MLLFCKFSGFTLALIFVHSGVTIPATGQGRDQRGRGLEGLSPSFRSLAPIKGPYKMAICTDVYGALSDKFIPLEISEPTPPLSFQSLGCR